MSLILALFLSSPPFLHVRRRCVEMKIADVPPEI